MQQFEQNMQYFKNMVTKAAIATGMRPEDQEDLLQEVYVDILEAEQRYDAALGASWLTFMHDVASGRVKIYLATRQADVIPLPERLGASISASRAAHSRLQQRLLREPTNREVAEEMGLTIVQYEDLRSKGDYKQVFMSDLDEGGESEFYEAVEFESTIDGSAVQAGPEEQAMEAEISDVLTGYLAGILPREKDVLVYLFGLDGQGERSMREVAELIEVSSPDTVQRLRDSAIRKIKGRGLSDALLRQVESINKGARSNG